MLMLANLEGEVTALTEGEFEVRRAELAPGGDSFLVTTSREHPGEEHLYRLPARGGALEQVTGGEGMHSWAVSSDGGRVAAISQSLTPMGDLYLMDPVAAADPVRITKSGTDAFYRTAWAGSEIVEYDLPDGTTAWARIWDAPAGATPGATPAVVYAHGCGECAQAVVKGWARSGSIVYANYLIQRGYAAASVDYRGSSGYGHRNRTYAYRQMGVSDIDSALPLLDILVDQYGVARDRIGVYGGSYGGFFTLMSLFRNPGKYAAGVALYPVTDWVHYNQGYTSRILNGDQLDDEEAYRVSSPVYYADGLQDALQIQHGLVDGNVQIQDSFRLAQILIEKQKDFDLVVYPVEDHGWDEIPTRPRQLPPHDRLLRPLPRRRLRPHAPNDGPALGRLGAPGSSPGGALQTGTAALRAARVTTPSRSHLVPQAQVARTAWNAGFSRHRGPQGRETPGPTQRRGATEAQRPPPERPGTPSSAGSRSTSKSPPPPPSGSRRSGRPGCRSSPSAREPTA